MSVLVTGSCGYVGRHVAAHFHKNQIDVVTLDKQKNVIQLFGKHYEYELGVKNWLDSVAKNKQMASELQEVTSIVHLAPGVDALEEISAIASYIPKLSNLVVLNGSEHLVSRREDSRYFVENDESLRMAATELLATKLINANNIPIVIIRSPRIFGANKDKWVYEGIRKIRANDLIKCGMDLFSYIPVDQVCIQLNEICIGNFVPPGAVVHLTGSNQYSDASFLAVLNTFAFQKRIAITESAYGRSPKNFALESTETTDRFGIPQYDASKFLEDLKAVVDHYKGEYYEF